MRTRRSTRGRPQRFPRLALIVTAHLVFTLIVVGVIWTFSVDPDPAPPSGLSAEPLSPTSVKLSWRLAKRAERYVVRVASNRLLTTDPFTVHTAGPTATLTDLASNGPGIERFYRVDAYRGDEFVSSRVESFNLPPGDVSALKVTKANHVGARLTWDKATNARQYDVIRATDKNFSTDVVAMRTASAEPSFTTADLKSDTTYYFKVRPVNADLTGSYSKTAATKTKDPATVFKVATYNVCSEKCGGYRGRAQIAAKQLVDAGVDVFGLQEAGGKRVGPTTASIFGGGERGFALASGGQKARYVFYRPALFAQMGGGSIALGHGRYATWARLRAKDTRAEFYFLSIHLENGHGNDAKRASQMGTLVSRMQTINDAGLPVIYAGDFNSHPQRRSDSPTAILRSISVNDTLQRSKSTPLNARVNSGHTFSTNVLTSGAHVDHVYASSDFEVRSWEQLVRISAGRYVKPMASDHNAISAVVALAVDLPKLGKPTAATPLER